MLPDGNQGGHERPSLPEKLTVQLAARALERRSERGEPLARGLVWCARGGLVHLSEENVAVLQIPEQHLDLSHDRCLFGGFRRAQFGRNLQRVAEFF